MELHHALPRGLLVREEYLPVAVHVHLARVTEAHPARGEGEQREEQESHGRAAKQALDATATARDPRQ